MIKFADMHAIKHTLNSKTEAHSYPLWTVGERANKINRIQTQGDIENISQGEILEDVGSKYHLITRFQCERQYKKNAKLTL